MRSLRARICCVNESLGGTGRVTGVVGMGGGAGGKVGTEEVVAMVVLVDSRMFVFIRLNKLLFLGQFRAMWPWVRHLKHHPLARYWVRSSSMSFLNGSVVFAASTSIGMCWLLLVQGVLFEHCLVW
jgi:hypothetical protein